MYEDSNGILHVEDTDPISPLNTLLNTLQAATSSAVGSTLRIYPVSSTSTRDALAAQHSPTPAKPLLVWRDSAAEGKKLEYTTNGTDWYVTTLPVLGRHARYRSTDASVNNATATTVGAWNGTTYRFDPNNDWSATSGASATANFTGMARVRARVTFATNATGIRVVQIHKNGENAPVQIARASAISGYATDVAAEWEGSVVPGDEFTVVVWQNSGSSLSLQAARHGCSFIVERTT